MNDTPKLYNEQYEKRKQTAKKDIQVYQFSRFYVCRPACWSLNAQIRHMRNAHRHYQ